MPRRNIYIRNEDLVLWESIEDKPAFIHQAISRINDRVDIDTSASSNKRAPFTVLERIKFLHDNELPTTNDTLEEPTYDPIDE